MTKHFSESRHFEEVNCFDERYTSEEFLLSGEDSDENFEEINMAEGQSKTHFYKYTKALGLDQHL